MDLFSHIHAERLHHAYLIEGGHTDTIARLRDLLFQFGIETKGNPDFHLFELDVFLLEHAHRLRAAQQLTGHGLKKIFIVAFNTIGSEAQNALLKTLEEPTEGTHFFFVTRVSEQLFPTLRSRMHIIKKHANQADDSFRAYDRQAQLFLEAASGERMNMIASMTKAKADEKSEAKEDARHFLDALESALYRQMDDTHDVAHCMETIIDAKRALFERSPSLKILLEHIALTVPHRSSVSV